MAVRDSETKFLEVLESLPATDVPIEVDVFSGANPATMLATLEGARGKRFMREMSELGTGGFVLSRADPKAVLLAIGNLVKFRVGGIHRHAIWIEEPATVVVSPEEDGGEDVKVDGRGVLAYIERPAVYPPIWPIAAASVIASASADNGAGTTSLAVGKPAGTLAGDVVVVAIACVGDAPSMPTGWTRIREATNGTLRLVIDRRRILASEPASWTWHWAAATKATGAATALRSANADDTTWGIGDTTGSGTSVELPSASVGLVDGVILGYAASAASTSFTPPAGLTEAVDRATTGRTLEVSWEENPALGDTGDRTATAGSAADWIAAQLFIPSTASNDATFTGATFGAVLKTLIDEAQTRGAIPFLTYDFTGDVDSHGEPWPDTHDLSFHIGTTLLEVWRHLVTLGLEGGMTPDLRLQAFVDASRHFEDTVILRKGHHFAGEVVDMAHGTGLRSRLLVEGAGGRVVEITDPAMEADALIGRREGYLELSTSDNPTTLQRAGEYALESSSLDDEARSVVVDHGTAAEGLYEPWVDYRESDWIGIDADGSGGEATAQRVYSITLEETEAGGYTVELELNSPEMDAFLRLQRRLDALSRSTTASGSGGGSGGGGTAGGKVSSIATDTPGYLFDKLATDTSLVKALVGEVGSQRVALSVAPGGTHPNLAAHDALGLATDAELAAAIAALPTGAPTTADYLVGTAQAGLSAEIVVGATPGGELGGTWPSPTVDATHSGSSHAAAQAAAETTAAGALSAHVGAADPHTGYQKESEKGAASGYAGLGAGGLVPIAQLASGTPDGTKFIRDDGTLITPAGGGGGGSLTVEEVDGTPTDSAVTKLVLPNGTLAIASHVATYTPAGGGGGGSDLVQVASGAGSIVIPGLKASPDAVPGSPSGYDREFDSAPGGTTLGTLDTDNITDFASHQRIGRAAGSWRLNGKYWAAPTPPFTMTAKLSDHSAIADYRQAAIFVGEATPGKALTFGPYFETSQRMSRQTWASPTSKSAYSMIVGQPLPIYLQMIVTSSTDIVCKLSYSGLIYAVAFATVDPGFTVGSVGLVMSDYYGTLVEAVFDWIRFT